MFSTINFYAYLASPPARVVLSTHSTLEELEDAIACAQVLKLTHVVIHIGMQPMDERDVLKNLEGRPPGTYATSLAAQVIPQDRISAAVALDSPPPRLRRADPPVNGRDGSQRARPGRKTNPDSARSKGRVIFSEMHPASKDVEIKRRMAEELGITMQVANTYFCDFRDEQQAIEAESEGRAAT